MALELRFGAPKKHIFLINFPGAPPLHPAGGCAQAPAFGSLRSLVRGKWLPQVDKGASLRVPLGGNLAEGEEIFVHFSADSDHKL